MASTTELCPYGRAPFGRRRVFKNLPQNSWVICSRNPLGAGWSSGPAKGPDGLTHFHTPFSDFEIAAVVAFGGRFE